ncbi:hypothetical protein EXIGLDRAFT_781169 [Exidia glandulosa HHB12029]|uniref:DNA-directed RNA polymerase subunit n=1 Tax=Exidia glandulosa HHB12029 TaxID=1314781 RepID=A0A165BBT3_EXIGL|nr:hypothetical protein EXIGLDRAFT_781169 [Exidia glandulosa HHB12029]
MLFCPNCANLLVTGIRDTGQKWACNSCPYEFPITKQHTARTRIKTKEPDVMLGAESRQGETMEIPCPKCEHDKAFFNQMQIRSADEPMTTFYKCINCGHVWKSD